MAQTTQGTELLSQTRRLFICQTINNVKPNNLSLKYQRFTQSGCKDIRIRKLSLWQKLSFFMNKKHLGFPIK